MSVSSVLSKTSGLSVPIDTSSSSVLRRDIEFVSSQKMSVLSLTISGEMSSTSFRMRPHSRMGNELNSRQSITISLDRLSYEG
ncbi:hypothetical protein DY000_02030225 [Brassica cretica]|uniref:Uncharacterized protein n=1 Tax=Brassica cretica TaxID=69181 RepID=A0ABQ7DDR6_BRACR|nr:hypothetical protein DY000_02030226 [Brassica cretica]KAF3575769.1 hypothetical protein DY000_02030225 [Brassica cretica]